MVPGDKSKEFPPKKEGTPRNFRAGLFGTPRLLCLGAVAPSSPLSYAIAQKQKSECIQLLFMLSLHKAETIWTENVERTEKTNGIERVKIMSLVGHSDYNNWVCGKQLYCTVVNCVIMQSAALQIDLLCKQLVTTASSSQQECITMTWLATTLLCTFKAQTITVTTTATIRDTYRLNNHGCCATATPLGAQTDTIRHLLRFSFSGALLAMLEKSLNTSLKVSSAKKQQNAKCQI